MGLKLKPPALCHRLQSADIFILPSMEDRHTRTVAGMRACGLTVIVRPNTGASDLVEEGIAGSIVAICDTKEIATQVLQRWDKIRQGRLPHVLGALHKKPFWECFEKNLLEDLARILN